VLEEFQRDRIMLGVGLRVIPRGKYIGNRVGDPPQDETETLHQMRGVRRLVDLP